MLRLKSNSGFSIILAMLMTGFMVVLTTGIFLLVLSESKDTRSMEYYFKSLEGAQGGLELAMLKLKEYNYSYSERLDTSSPLSKVLFQDRNSYSRNKDVVLTYDISGITSNITNKNIKAGDFEIIPLFFYDSFGVYSKARNISITGLNNDVVWNIVGKSSGISGVGDFISTSTGNYKTMFSDVVSFGGRTISDFLASEDYNYLIIHNLSSGDVTYTLKSLTPGEYFAKDKVLVISSGEVGGYRQNLKTEIDTSKYLNLLKYSIFSN